MTPSLHHMVFTLLNTHPGVLQNDHFYLSSGKHVTAESFEVSDRWFPAVNWTALTWRNNIVGSMCAYRPLTIAACSGFSESLNLRECLLASFLSIGTVIKPLEACQNDFVLQVLLHFLCCTTIVIPCTGYTEYTTLQQHNPWKTCCTSAFTRHSLTHWRQYKFGN